MKKRTVCKDGHCTEVVEVLEPPPLPPPTSQEIQWSPRDDAGFNPQAAMAAQDRWAQSQEIQWSPRDDAGFNPQAAMAAQDRWAQSQEIQWSPRDDAGFNPQAVQWAPQDQIPNGIGPIPADAGFSPQEGHMHSPPTYAEMHVLPYREEYAAYQHQQQLNHLVENMQHRQHQQQPPVMEPMRNMQPPSYLRTILDRIRHVQRQRPQEPGEIVIGTSGKGSEILLKPLPQESWFERLWRYDMDQVEISRPTPQYDMTEPWSVQAPDMTLVMFAVAIVAVGAAYALVMSALHCFRMDQVSARERPLREFAEPLAPDSVNVAIPGAAAKKADSVRMYLSSLYTRANAKNEARGVTTYLARLYARILA